VLPFAQLDDNHPVVLQPPLIFCKRASKLEMYEFRNRCFERFFGIAGILSLQEAGRKQLSKLVMVVRWHTANLHGFCVCGPAGTRLCSLCVKTKIHF
jgi:hypothetical protein